MIAEAFLVLGSAAVLLAALGMLRFDDVFIRTHVLSKASTFGILSVVVGGLVATPNLNDATTLSLAAALHLITSPVGTNLLARSTYFAEGIDHGIDVVDELAEISAARHRSERP